MSDKVKFNCEAKHTKYQPTDEEFNCPKCGAKVGDFYKEDPVGHEECELLHDEDNLCCAQCGYGCSGKAFAARIVKEKSMVKCPMCSGKGMVKQDINGPDLAVRLQTLLEVWKKRLALLNEGGKDQNVGGLEQTSIMASQQMLEDVIKQAEEVSVRSRDRE